MRRQSFLALAGYEVAFSIRASLLFTFLSLYLRTELGMSVTEASLPGSLSLVVNATSQAFFWGKLSDRLHARSVLLFIGEFALAVGYLGIFLLYRHYLALTAIRAAAYCLILGFSFLEFFWSGSLVGFFALLADVSKPKERGRLMGVFEFFFSAGRIVGIGVGGLLYDYGYRAAGFSEGYLFYIVSLSMFVSAFLILVARRSLNLDVAEQSASVTVPLSLSSKKDERLSDRDLGSYDLKRVYIFIVIICIAYLGRTSILQTILYFSTLPETVAASSLEVSFIAMGPYLSGITLAPVLGWLGDRTSPRVVLLGAMLICVVSPLAFPFATSLPQMILLSYIHGAAATAFITVGYAIISGIIPPERRAELLGKYNAARLASFGLSGTLIGGPVADYWLRRGATEWMAYVATFWVSAFLCFLVTVLFLINFKKFASTSSLRQGGL